MSIQFDKNVYFHYEMNVYYKTMIIISISAEIKFENKSQ